MSRACVVCGHPDMEHGQEREFFLGVDSKRELCLGCPGYVVIRGGYEVDGYPIGKAWHRFRDGGKAL